MTSDTHRGTPPAVSPDTPAAAMYPRLGRGLIWSDLVREMEEDWAAAQRKRAEAGQAVIELPLRGIDDNAADHERGEAA